MWRIWRTGNARLEDIQDNWSLGDIVAAHVELDFEAQVEEWKAKQLNSR